MTIEEYQEYLIFCFNMQRSPYDYWSMKNMTYLQAIKKINERINKHDFAYLEHMKSLIDEKEIADKAKEKYFLKKHWDVNLKIK